MENRACGLQRAFAPRSAGVAPPVYRPQPSSTQLKSQAPAVYRPYRPQSGATQSKPATLPMSRPQTLATQMRATVPLVYGPQPSEKPLIAITSPRDSRSTLQRMTADPTDFRFLHHTVSPYFTSGATKGSPGEHLDKVVDDIKKHKTAPLAFPPLPIFTITDPAGIYEPETYSLSNRRLYVFKKSGTQVVNVRRATIQEAIDALWKMTNESGGYTFPSLTNFGNKTTSPTGLLGEFKEYCRQNQAAPGYPANVAEHFNFR